MATIQESIGLATINQKKATLFAIAWQMRSLHGLRKYPEVYRLAKENIGHKSLVFNVSPYPKVVKDTPAEQRILRVYYQLLERSLSNDEWQVSNLMWSWVQNHTPRFHKLVSQQASRDLFQDCLTPVPETGLFPYSEISRGIARALFEEEDLNSRLGILADTLEDTGHVQESDHFRTGRHSPACPVLRKIGGVK